jgi:hypothetical protein
MEDDFDLKELSIVLGLNNNSNQLNNISLNKKKNSFISAISDILYSNNLDELFEPIETETSSNEMLDNFIKNAKIEGIGSVKLELYKDSNFIENIKGDSNILSKPQIDFSNEYITKLQKDFIKEEQVVMQPIEIQKNEDKSNYINKSKKKSKEKIGNEEQKNNEEMQEKKGMNEENKKEEEDEKETKNENDIKNNNIENEEYEEKNGTNNNGRYNHQNNGRPYNKKYNRNKGHKEYRQKLNSRKFKNYK